MTREEAIKKLNRTVGQPADFIDSLVALGLLDLDDSPKMRVLHTENERLTALVERLQQQCESLRLEIHRLRTDPLYLPEGEYWFVSSERLYRVRIVLGKIELIERLGTVDYLLPQIPGDPK